MKFEPWTIDAAVYDKLVNDATLSALIGSRVSNTAASDGLALPYVVFFRISTVDAESSGFKKKYRRIVYQVEAYSKASATKSAMQNVADIVAALDGALDGETLSPAGADFVCSKFDREFGSEFDPDEGLARVIVQYVVTAGVAR